MRYVVAALLCLAVVAIATRERHEPVRPPVQQAPAVERGSVTARATPPVAGHRPIPASSLHQVAGRAELPAIDQPVTTDLGFVVDGAAMAWLPHGFLLREGDAVLQVNGEPVTSSRQLVEAVRGSSEGSAVELQVRFLRTGKTTTYWASN